MPPAALPPLPANGRPLPRQWLTWAEGRWRAEDWTALASGLPACDLLTHPDRARLALLASGAHQRLGDRAACRELALLARAWGSRYGEMATHLEGSVHALLRAAPAPQAAIGAKVLTLVPPEEQGRSRRADEAALEAMEQRLENLNKAQREAETQWLDAIVTARKQLEAVFKKELLNATKQLEAFLNVQSALSGGDLIPGLHGWPISPDLAAYLIELIRANDYDVVIEFGSGTSTVVMAKALAQMRHRREGKAPVVQMAFEHLEAYHAQTQAQLRAAGLAEAATVRLAPLAPYQAANGKTYPYYTCQPALQALKATYDKPNCRALVLVDGPPASTGEHARYPAASAVTSVLPHAAMDVLLDDLIREDEQQVALMWQDDLKAAGREAVAEVRKMEKDACLIRVQPQPATS